MTKTLMLVSYMAVITWLIVLVASLLRARAWTFDGLKVAFGNREALPAATPLAARTDRAAKNTQENFMLFAALAICAHLAGAPAAQVELGAEIFFWARVAYIPIYMAGITHVRTLVWFTSIGGLGVIFAAICCNTAVAG